MPTRKSSLSVKANKPAMRIGAKFDSFGNKMTWFGYKIHLAVDTQSEPPIALEVTPAHVNDGDMAPGLIEKVASQSKIRYFMLDAGYDQMKVYEAARNVKAQAIIPLNPRGEKEPPAGMTTNGTPCCSMGYAMTYWGADGDYLKFRCPLGMNHLLVVQLRHGSQSRYQGRLETIQPSASGYQTMERTLQRTNQRGTL